MKFITLMTDFGLQDGYTGVMRGVIYRIVPDVQIADITHAIHPQNVVEGALVWFRSTSYFPAGTIHVGVVDPGVGTRRRPIAARLGNNFYVCPDNGLLTLLLEVAEKERQPVEIVHLDKPRYWLPQVSNVFHGRDIFSPVAAHLAAGVPLSELGTPINDPVRLEMPRPEQLSNGWRGQVITVDTYGNLGTNLPRSYIEGMEGMRVHIIGKEIAGLSKTFGERPAGELVAFIDSDDHMAVAVVNGNAARELNISVGTPVEVVRNA